MKKKISLKNLEVQSFVTSMDENNKQTVQGGAKTIRECLLTWHMTNCQTCGLGCTNHPHNCPTDK